MFDSGLSMHYCYLGRVSTVAIVSCSMLSLLASRRARSCAQAQQTGKILRIGFLDQALLLAGRSSWTRFG